MRVAVMAVSYGAGHLFNGNDAPVKLFASFVFKLNCRVLNGEMIAQNVIELEQDAGALGWGNIGDADMTGERMAVGAEAPDVQVVDIQNAVDFLHASPDLTERNAARRALQEDVE